MRVRVWAAAASIAALASMAACGGGETPAPSGSSPGPAGTSTAAAPTTPATSVAAPLTCDMVRGASIGSKTVKYHDYDGIPLLEGRWAGEDGNEVELRECAVGDLDGDGAIDVLAAVSLNAGGTGRFWSLDYWRNVDGEPVYSAHKDLDDRTPVESITIAAAKATVVWLTRGATDPAIALTIRRTSVFTLSGPTLGETSFTDAPYTP